MAATKPVNELPEGVSINPEVDSIPYWDEAAGVLRRITPDNIFTGTFAEQTHAAQHQHGGADEVATVTPAPNAIPKADGDGKLDGWVTPYTHPNHAGDVTSAGDGATTIVNDAVTNAKLANMAQSTIKGRASGAGTGDPTDLTAAQVRTVINVADGADVTSATNVGSSIHGAAAKTTPVDADTMPLIDSAASNVLKKITWANIKATLTTLFNGLYVLLDGKAGGQHIKGGTAASENLTLESTNHATKGNVLLQPNGGKVAVGTATPLTTTAMQLSSGVFTDSNISAEAPAVSSRAEVLQTWKVSDSDDFFLLSNASPTNGRLSPYFMFRNVSANPETLGVIYEAVPANDTGTEPAIVIAAYTRTSAQAFAAMATRPLIHFRNLSTTYGALLANGNWGFGTAAPQGRLHVHDGVGGMLFATKTGINATAQVIIPDGAGDVTGRVVVTYSVKVSDGASIGGQITIAVSGTAIIYNVSGNTLELRVNANGSLDVRRTAGTLTFSLTVNALWE